MLLIDDIQFLASKAKTEEEFFHTFNALYENGRQLVLTCDRLPSQLDGIEQRLRERFEAGLVAEIAPPISPPGWPSCASGRRSTHRPGARSDVLELIAARVTDNVRALEGALIRVVAFHSLTGQPLDRELAAHVLDGLHYARSPGPGAAPVSLDSVKSAVAAHYGSSVERDGIAEPDRPYRLAATARHLPRPGADRRSTDHDRSRLWGRNHATVLHACKRVAQRRRSDQQTAVEIDELARSLRGELGDRDC